MRDFPRLAVVARPLSGALGVALALEVDAGALVLQPPFASDADTLCTTLMRDCPSAAACWKPSRIGWSEQGQDSARFI